MPKQYDPEDSPLAPGVVITDIEHQDLEADPADLGWKYLRSAEMPGGRLEYYSSGDHVLEMGWTWSSADRRSAVYLLSPLVINGNDHPVTTAEDVISVLSDTGLYQSPREWDAISYRNDPELLPERALLGSLLHVPEAIGAVRMFLRDEDFSHPDMRALYQTLIGLYLDYELQDVAGLPTDRQRMSAANENHLRLFNALRMTPPKYANWTIMNIPRIIAQINSVAPVEGLPYRGVYDPRSQVRLGRMVLEDAIRRQLSGIGVRMRQAEPLVPEHVTNPGELFPAWSRRGAHTLLRNVEAIEAQLHYMTARLLEAVKQTGRDATEGATERAELAVARASARRRRAPDHLRVLFESTQHRAEQGILHLALHAGLLEKVPVEILDLPPEAFANSRHANMWRTIQDLRARGEPVNYVSLHRETQAESFAHHPMMSDRALARMAAPPELKPQRVARYLRTLVSTALSRARVDSWHAITAVSADRSVPVETALNRVKADMDGLAERARSTTQQHHEITSWQSSTRRTR